MIQNLGNTGCLRA